MEESAKVTEATRTNKTGLATQRHPDLMQEVTKLTKPSSHNGGIRKVHAAYQKESHAIGTIPPPMNAKGVAKAAVQGLKGKKAIALADRASERLAFERTGVRLYDALLDKMEINGSFKGGPKIDQVREIRDEELAHAHMLKEALEKIGADPTSMTPSADLVSVEGMGLGAVLGDPRTTVGHCLHALLTAELADGEGWTLLRTLAEDLGQTDLAERFSRAEQEEDRHLELVRGWLLAHARVEAELV